MAQNVIVPSLEAKERQAAFGGQGPLILAVVLATAAALATVDGIVDDIVVDTADIQSRIPAALVNGRMDARVSQVHNSEFDSGTGTDVDPWIMTPI